jgi:hypothetical protein
LKSKNTFYYKTNFKSLILRRKEYSGKAESGRKGGRPLTCRRVDDSVQIFWGRMGAGATGVRGSNRGTHKTELGCAALPEMPEQKTHRIRTGGQENHSNSQIFSTRRKFKTSASVPKASMGEARARNGTERNGVQIDTWGTHDERGERKGERLTGREATERETHLAALANS